MKKLSQLGRLYKSRRNRQDSRKSSTRRCITLEQLEDRSMLAAATFPGNFAPPDLVIPATISPVVTAGQPITLNLLTAGATVEDVDAEDDPTGDTIRFYLDPDVGTDTPTGASITTAGVFTWTPTAAQVGTHKIVVIAVDSGTPALADAETFTVTVNAATPSAVVDLNGPDAGIDTTAAFTEGGAAAVIIDEDATITDDDDTNLESATITLTNRPDGDDESLNVTTTDTLITANYNSTTGVLSLTGSDTVANYQKVIRTLKYSNVSPEPDTTARVVNVLANDGTSNSAVAKSTVTIVAVDDPPSVDLNGPDSGTGFTATFTESGPAVAIVGATSLVISDVDSANLSSATITITNLLDGAAELLEVITTGTNITANYSTTATTGVLALTGSDTLASYQQVLRTLKYSNSSQNPNSTARSIRVVVKDSTSESQFRTATVNIVRANDAPDLAAIADQSATVGILFELPVTATDPDGDELVYQLDRTGINTPASATITKNSNNEAVIRWTPTVGDGAGPFTFRVLVTEQGTADLFTDQQEFTVSIVTAPPSVDANGDGTGVDFAASFTEGDVAKIIVDTDLSVADFDSTNLASATVTITNLQNGADETLEVVTTGTAITANYANGVLTLTGSDSVAAYQQVLRTLKYGNVSQDPGTTDRVIEIVVNDGANTSAPATTTVTVTPVNDPVDLTLPPAYATGSPVEVPQDSTVDFTATVQDPDQSLAEIVIYLKPGTSIPGSAIQPDITFDGHFVWIADVPGTYTITVLASDGAGSADQETFTITVVAPPAPISAGENEVNAETIDAVFDSL